MQIIIERHNVNGSLILSTIKHGIRFCQVYYGYTRSEAKLMFRAYVNDQLSSIA